MQKFISAADLAALDEMSLVTQLYCDPDEDKTVQSDADDADINKLAVRFGLVQPPLGAADPAFYGDFSEITDFHSAASAIREAEQSFESLPSYLRDRFDNAPYKLLEFIEDPKNALEAAELGLLTDEAARRIITAHKEAKKVLSDPPAPQAPKETAPEPSK